jgi:predicted dehydrogenase
VLDAVLMGAGLRGMFAYGPAAEAAGVRFVEVVDPVAWRREAFGAQHGIPADRRHATVADWSAAPRPPGLRAAVVATPDHHHVAPALAALEAGLDVLVEKPLAPSPAECLALVAAAERAGRQLHVCHVLRCTPFFGAVRDVVRSGRLGRIVTVEHRSNVDALHMAHSYVRGAYGREDRSNPMLLAKCCHDLDLLGWILDDPMVRVSSFGSLAHYRPESAGPEIPERCTDGCPIESTCPWSAIAAYAPEAFPTGPEVRMLTALFPLADPPSLDRAERLEALRTSPYGRCVYRCDNDVVDHQVVAMETASGTTVSLAMHGHSHDETRTMRYDGTRATLRATFGEHPSITVHDHGTGEVTEIDPGAGSGLDHGGGDGALLAAFARSVLDADPEAADEGADEAVTHASGALASHLVGFAAEEARRTGTVVDVAAFAAHHGA